MSVYKNILVAIDLSDESQQVVDKALAITGVGDHLALVHVVRPIEHVYGGFGAMGLAGDFSEQMATLEQQALAHAAQKLKDLGLSSVCRKAGSLRPLVTPRRRFSAWPGKSKRILS